MTKLPKGQIETTRFPPIGERAPLDVALDLSRWRLELSGCVHVPLLMTWPEFQGLAQQERVVDLHCVTGWSRLGTRFTGIPLSALLALAKPTEAARFVRFEAYSERRHDTSLPLSVAAEDTWLVHSVDGQPLEVRHGFPLRTLTPSRWLYKSLKWVHRIELLEEDVLGFWERESGYHNNGDPWAEAEERYVHGDLSKPMLEKFRTSRRMDRFRGKVILHADLRDWTPATLELSQLALKNCNLRGANLRGANLNGANLTRCRFEGADLRDADLSAADLEGANFAGADLRGANLEGALLTAVCFQAPAIPPARVDGVRWANVVGLLEEAEAFLRQHAGSGQ